MKCCNSVHFKHLVRKRWFQVSQADPEVREMQVGLDSWEWRETRGIREGAYLVCKVLRADMDPRETRGQEVGLVIKAFQVLLLNKLIFQHGFFFAMLDTTSLHPQIFYGNVIDEAEFLIWGLNKVLEVRPFRKYVVFVWINIPKFQAGSCVDVQFGTVRQTIHNRPRTKL